MKCFFSGLISTLDTMQGQMQCTLLSPGRQENTRILSAAITCNLNLLIPVADRSFFLKCYRAIIPRYKRNRMLPNKLLGSISFSRTLLLSSIAWLRVRTDKLSLATPSPGCTSTEVKKQVNYSFCRFHLCESIYFKILREIWCQDSWYRSCWRKMSVIL